MRFHLRLSALAAVCAAWSAAPDTARSQAGAFALDRLPPGKSVTIPRPATTVVPLTSRLSLTATDRPQSVSFKAVNQGGGPLLPLRIAIYDANQERVQYVDVRPNTPFLYAFKEVGGKITVVPDQRRNVGAGYVSMRLVVESDRPLEIAH